MDIKYTLDKSKGSQTAIVPKSTYKELQPQLRLAKITAVLHLHNKYNTLKVLVKIPDEYKDYPLGFLDFNAVKRNYKWANHMPLPELSGVWKSKVTNRVDDDWKTYNINEDEYYYAIENVVLVRNKKYKAPPVEDRHVLLRQETELNTTLEEFKKQEDALTIKIQEAQIAWRVLTRELEEAVLAKEEVITKKRDVKVEIAKIKIEIAEIKIKLEINNKNGFVILTNESYGGKDQVYGQSKTFKEAQNIAKEAGKHDFTVGEKIEALLTKDNKWYGATITKVYKLQKKYDVEWDDKTTSCYLHEKKIKKTTDYNKFNSVRIVDLDIQIEVEKYGMYKDCGSDVW